MGVRRPLALALVAVVLLAGCGEEERAATAPRTVTTPGFETAELAFTPEGPRPARVVADAAGGLVVRSLDGRPHVLRLTTPGRPEVVVQPDGAASVDLSQVPPGDYRIVPTGATPPIPLVVR